MSGRTPSPSVYTDACGTLLASTGFSTTVRDNTNTTIRHTLRDDVQTCECSTLPVCRTIRPVRRCHGVATWQSTVGGVHPAWFVRSTSPPPSTACSCRGRTVQTSDHHNRTRRTQGCAADFAPRTSLSFLLSLSHRSTTLLSASLTRVLSVVIYLPSMGAIRHPTAQTLSALTNALQLTRVEHAVIIRSAAGAHTQALRRTRAASSHLPRFRCWLAPLIARSFNPNCPRSRSNSSIRCLRKSLFCPSHTLRSPNNSSPHVHPLRNAPPVSRPHAPPLPFSGRPMLPPLHPGRANDTRCRTDDSSEQVANGCRI